MEGAMEGEGRVVSMARGVAEAWTVMAAEMMEEASREARLADMEIWAEVVEGVTRVARRAGSTVRGVLEVRTVKVEGRTEEVSPVESEGGAGAWGRAVPMEEDLAELEMLEERTEGVHLVGNAVGTQARGVGATAAARMVGTMVRDSTEGASVRVASRETMVGDSESAGAVTSGKAAGVRSATVVVALRAAVAMEEVGFREEVGVAVGRVDVASRVTAAVPVEETVAILEETVGLASVRAESTTAARKPPLAVRDNLLWRRPMWWTKTSRTARRRLTCRS